MRVRDQAKEKSLTSERRATRTDEPGVDVMETLTGMSKEEMWEYEWPSGRSLSDFFLLPQVPVRGNPRINAGWLVDAEEVERELKKESTRPLK